jgi:hypothetical protein
VVCIIRVVKIRERGHEGLRIEIKVKWKSRSTPSILMSHLDVHTGFHIGHAGSTGLARIHRLSKSPLVVLKLRSFGALSRGVDCAQWNVFG